MSYFSGSHPLAGMNTNVVPGTTRFNTNQNRVEVWDGATWMQMSTGDVRDITLEEMVQDAEDKIALQIEEEYKDNATIIDAFNKWEEANERFKVILALAEKK